MLADPEPEFKSNRKQVCSSNCKWAQPSCPLCDKQNSRRRCLSETSYIGDPINKCDRGCDYTSRECQRMEPERRGYHPQDVDMEIYKNIHQSKAFNKKYIPIAPGNSFRNFHHELEYVNGGLPDGSKCPTIDEHPESKPKFKNCQNGDVPNYSKIRSSYIERDRCSAEMRAKYIREMEVLKSRLSLLREGIAMDGKRLRHRSDSEPGISANNGGVPKRARDNYNIPPVRRKLPSPVPGTHQRQPPVVFKRESKSMPPCICSDHSSNGHSSSSRASPVSVKMRSTEDEDVSSDSELEGSTCGEDVVSQEEGNISEDDAQSVLSSLTSSSGSNTPSRVGETLESITLNEIPKRETPVTTIPHLQAPRKPQSNPFRSSLFSYVPPYVKFTMHDSKGPPLPSEVSKLLKWKLSTITPVVIRRTLVNSGFKLVRKSNDWTGQWGKHMKSFVFKTLKDFQKLNHFPGTFQIGRKDRLWKNLYRLMLKFGKKEFGFIPRTYILPQDSKSLRAAWEKCAGKGQWIVKPPAAARGTGIKVVHKWNQIPKKRPLIVQKYITQPYLINGSKFDLRLYVLMTSIHPLRIYVYDDGLVRFASVKYSCDSTTLGDRFMHLTNYSINKLSNQYCANEDASACHGHKWTLKSLWSYMARMGINVDALQKNLIDLIIKTIISGESSIAQLSRNNLTSRYCSYELFGIDVLLDEHLKPWLLEVNISPSLHSSSPLDLAVKGPMVRDLLNVAGFQVPAKLLKEQQDLLLEGYGLKDKQTSFCYDKRLYNISLGKHERMKQASFATCSRDEYMNSILDDLTPDDVRHLIQYEDELTQIGRFEKVFPTPNTHYYHQYFETPRYYNMMFDAWETKYCRNRCEGIKILETLCKQKFHLIVPFPGGKTKSSASPNTLLSQLLPQELEDLETEESSEEDSMAVPIEAPKASSIILKVAKQYRKPLPRSNFLTGKRNRVVLSPRSSSNLDSGDYIKSPIK